MTVDPLEIIRQWLITPGTTLATLVGSRVFYPWLPENPSGVTIFDNSVAGIVIVGIDGTPAAEAVVQSVDVEIRCFGGGAGTRKEPRDAWKVYTAMREAMTRDDGQFVYGKQLPGGRLLSAEETNAGTHEIEPGLKWPFVSSNWAFEVTSE